MKKRLFISSILMTLVLLVAITTATFAWYSASQTAATKKHSTTDSITASASATAATMGQVEFVPHIQAVGTAINGSDLSTLTGFELSNSAGARGFVSGGAVSTTTGDNVCYQMIQVRVTTALTGQTEGVTLTQAMQSLYTVVTSHKLVLHVTPAGNVVVASDDEGVLDAGAKGAANGASIKTEVTVDLDFQADGLKQDWIAYFVVAIRPNNENGLEAIDQTTALAAQDYKLGDIVKYSDKLYICKAAYTESNASANVAEDTTHWVEAVMHATNAITASIAES